jgi:hypothetical protein
MGWSLLVSQFLMPFLLKCFSQQADSSTESPQDYLRREYDASTGSISPSVVRQAMPMTAKAVRRAWRQTPKQERGPKPQLSREELYNLTQEKLVEAMNATPEQLAACAAMVAEMEDDS